MKVYVVTEVAKPFYYVPIERLKQEGRIEDWELWSFRTFRPLIKNIPLKVIRSFKPDFAKNRELEPITLTDFFSRLVLPIRMLFWDNIIFGMEPFDTKVIFPLLLKLLGKNVIEYTSWPYWESNFQPRTGIPGVRILWRLFLRNLKVVAVSPAAKEAVKKFEPTAKTTQIPHSVDFDKFFPKRGKRNKRPKIVSLIQLYPEKGVAELIELAKRIPQADFEIISRGGTLEKEVLQAQKELKNFKWVSDKDREKKLREADIFILASYRIHNWEELFGMVIVEAMASGVPVVATDQVGPRGIVEDGKTGFVVAQKDIDLMEERLLALIFDSKLRAKMGLQSREVAKRKYNIENISEKWFNVITAKS